MTEASFTRNSDNFCYRHPDRVSFVLCQRCLRTICPECQTQAAVGVVCPECMKQQQSDRSPAQKKAERRWGRGSGSVITASGTRTLAVTYILIAVTAAVSLVQMLPGIGPVVQDHLLFAGVYIDPEVGLQMQPWRALTVSLVHSGIMHLALNMLSLWMMGRILEPLLGHGRFLTLYLFSAVAGSIFMALWDPWQPVVGASGAIFGLFGALLVITRRLGGDITGIAVILGINLLIGFMPGVNIAWQAHVGGLIGGAVVGLVYTLTRQREQRTRQILMLVGFAAVLVALTFLIPVLHPLQ